MRKTALCFLLSLPLVACDPPPAANPDDAQPATPATDADAGAGAGAPATPDAEVADADSPPKADEVDQSNLPEAEALFASNVAAVGGQAKIDEIKSYYSESVMLIPAQKIEISNRMWWKDGDFYAEAEMPGMGMTKVWKVGEAMWSDDPINGMRKIEGKEAEQQMRNNSLVITADWKKHFETAKTTARRKVADKAIIDVLLTTKSGDEITLSFDEATSMVVEQKFIQETPQGSVPVRLKVDEYKDYDGFKNIAKSTLDMSVAVIQTTVTKFEPNAKVDAKKLKLPKAAK